MEIDSHRVSFLFLVPLSGTAPALSAKLDELLLFWIEQLFVGRLMPTGLLKKD